MMKLIIILWIIVAITGTHGSSAALTPSEFFSKTYLEADTKFVAACNSLKGAQPNTILETHCYDGLTGSQGESLCTRTCVFGNITGDVTLFAVSGVHGAEGFGPAVVQLRILTDTELGGTYAIPPKTRGVFIHAVEPWGWSHGFKENELNIDMLKNLNEVYRKTDYNQSIFVGFNNDLNIPHFNESSVQQTAAGLQGAYVNKYGGSVVQAAFEYGQNQVSYGNSNWGKNSTIQRDYVVTVVSKYLSSSSKIFLLDLHSAAGAYGTWQLSPYDDPSGTLFNSWIVGANLTSRVSMATLDKAGVGVLPWPLWTFVSEAYPTATVSRVVWEAGTYDQSAYQLYLIFGYWCRFFSRPGTDDAQCAVVNGKIREYFFPNKTDWMTAIQANMEDPLTVLWYGLNTMAGNSKSNGTNGTPAGANAGTTVTPTIFLTSLMIIFTAFLTHH